MFLADYHCHSIHSFDGQDSMEALVSAAENCGLTELAVTDHCDMGGSFDAGTHYSAFKKAKEYGFPLRYAIELGEPTHDLKRADALMRDYPYDFVIGSYHNLRGEQDFYRLDYPDFKTCEALITRYFAELSDMIEWGNFSVLGHFTYPLRYMRGRGGIDIDFSGFYDQAAQVYRALIEKGIGIELNVSGLRYPGGWPMPYFELLKLYRAYGGEIVTCGSDAHCAGDIGSYIREGYALLKEAGFRYVASFNERRVHFEAL